MADDFPFEIVLNDMCPPDRVYVMDPASVPWLAEMFDGLLGSKKQLIVCPDERTAERIREAAGRIGRIDSVATPEAKES